ncbi:hypothetical protein MGN70_011359 [Eutypa lata]|nr:hypothetical protein MGN70_011359 [Eutypa lata]
MTVVDAVLPLLYPLEPEPLEPELKLSEGVPWAVEPEPMPERRAELPPVELPPVDLEEGKESLWLPCKVEELLPSCTDWLCTIGISCQ